MYRTSGSENFSQKADIAISNKILSATANAKSITTYVISDVNFGDVSTRNKAAVSVEKNLYVKSQNGFIWSYKPAESGVVHVRLLDLKGQIVRQLYSGTVMAGCNYQGNISSQGLTAGVFLLVVESNGKRILQRCAVGR